MGVIATIALPEGGGRMQNSQGSYWAAQLPLLFILARRFFLTSILV